MDSLVRSKPFLEERDFERFLKTGGLPRICFQRETSIRLGYFESHLETLLDRDFRMIHPTSLPYGVIRSVLAEIAFRQGQPLEYADLSRETQVSTITLKKFLYLLSRSFC